MFDLRFHRIVKKILKWEQAPGSRFVNMHQFYLMQKQKQRGLDLVTENHDAMSEAEDLLHDYVIQEYPLYFGVELRVGDFIKHIDSTYFGEPQ